MKNDIYTTYTTSEGTKEAGGQEERAAFEQVLTDVPYVLNMRTCSCKSTLGIQCLLFPSHESAWLT